jgi:hypothetical protein
MEILMLDYCFKKFQNSFKKQRGASTFKCNAGRLLFKNKKKIILIHKNKRSLGTKCNAKQLFKNFKILCL